jgi:hypothetical protein
MFLIRYYLIKLDLLALNKLICLFVYKKINKSSLLTKDKSIIAYVDGGQINN